jgi:hypothetical protein
MARWQADPMRRLGALLSVAVLLGLGVAACSDDDEGEADGGSGEPLEVTLELASDEVASGGSVAATVHVRNTTDGPLSFARGGDTGRSMDDECAPNVGAGIAHPDEVQEARDSSFFTLDCRPVEEVAPGEELTFDFDLDASTIDPDSGDPVPFEPGDDYVAWILVSPEMRFAPVPDPTPITVTS